MQGGMQALPRLHEGFMKFSLSMILLVVMAAALYIYRDRITAVIENFRGGEDAQENRTSDTEGIRKEG